MANINKTYEPPPSLESTPLLPFSPNSNTNYNYERQREGSIILENLTRYLGYPVSFLIPGLVVGLTILGIVMMSPSAKVTTTFTNNLQATSNIEEEKGPIVDTPLGKVQANILESREGRKYFAFYKIPYAQPPIGNRRFKSPEPATKWDGIRFEKEVAPQCIQKAKYSPIIEAVGEEDCLYANIYTTKLPGTENNVTAESALMPTLFYIHGGGFTDGNGSRYGGKYFMDEDVVLVTFQYRLGPFGFLNTEDGEITGNMGFRDQVMGLRWVQDNIKYFGGDPNRVMIFGNSAGAFSVSHLMVSPMSNGLFHTAITQSGGSFCNALFQPSRGSTTIEALAAEVGCSSKSQRRLIRCLRNIYAHTLAVARNENITYNIVIENYETDDSNSDNVFMPDTPYNLVRNGKVNKVPWIVGVTSAEFVGTALDYLTDNDLVDELNSNFGGAGSEILNLDGPLGQSIAEKAKTFYFGENRIGNETVRNFSNLVSDRSLVHCSKTQALMQAEHSDVYLYYLSKKPAKSYADKAKVGFPPGDYGVAHADELQFFFDYYSYPEYPLNSPYYPFSRLLVRIWSQFAATGRPYSENGVDWMPATPGLTPVPYFELNDIPGPTTVLQSRLGFWDQFQHTDLSYNVY